MERSNVLIPTNDLKPGMVVGKDVVEGHIILLGKGIVLTEPIIKTLRKTYMFNKVEIVSDKPTHKLYNNEKGVEEIYNSFKNLSIIIEYIFQKLEDSPKLEIENVRKFSKRIQEELNSTGAIIKNVVLNGSGQDSIYRHSVNVAALSCILGEWIGLERSKINLLTYAAILHDYGKTKIQNNLLIKTEKLNKMDYKEIRNHPISAYKTTKKIEYLDDSVRLGVLMHHERLDGTGYPLGVKAGQINDFARIIAIADVYDAVNSDRAYRRSRGPFEALEIIKKESLGKLDYEYANIFLEKIINYYIGENVALNTGEICKIIQININDISHPLLLGESGFIDLQKHRDLSVEFMVL